MQRWLWSNGLLTCHWSFIQPRPVPGWCIRRSAQVEQSPDARSFHLAQRSGRLQYSGSARSQPGSCNPPAANVSFVRSADLDSKRSERPHPADSVEKLRCVKIVTKIRNILLARRLFVNEICISVLSRNDVLPNDCLSGRHRVFQHNPPKLPQCAWRLVCQRNDRVGLLILWRRVTAPSIARTLRSNGPFRLALNLPTCD
ncbi:hypothetical protein TG4357_03762 [Thalassovita gelatinovora]|uniref:Uncharacterized protein n=1 Tax=Thalassovita gelatinovora TaxID=53501 RepID=A0A0P1G3J7_THAGE|nr:hypothetical protein TG4357_03762 [Thalassovita gelatinovora]SEQ57420.1 hypothetical protein SAMN04488043_106223 [Thalassovita gelatinovora]